jgi:plasmid stabilization system protein ParE
MRKLEWTSAARNDLRRINAWLTGEANAQTAARLLTAIAARASFLLDFPEGGPSLPSGSARSLRVPDTPYTLYYRLVGSDRIQILRVYHHRQDRPTE